MATVKTRKAPNPSVSAAATIGSSLDASAIRVGDIFSETSHYTCLRIDDNVTPHRVYFRHAETGAEVDLTMDYVLRLLRSADQFVDEIKVGKEDKLWTDKQITEAETSGDLPVGHKVRPDDVRIKGIRSIWQDIHNSDVLMVCFTKQDKALSQKALTAEREKRADAALTIITKTAKNKEGVAAAAREEIIKALENPVLPYEAGEERVLWGYKIQFESRDGRYNCIDMKLDASGEGNIRPVNINTIKWLVYHGHKYVVE